MSNEINNCPFCDSENIAASELHGDHWVTCIKCDTEGPVDSNKEKAIKLWNSASNSPSKKSTKRYKLVTGTAKEVEKIVNEMLANGWDILDSPFLTSPDRQVGHKTIIKDNFAQAMVKEG